MGAWKDLLASPSGLPNSSPAIPSVGPPSFIETLKSRPVRTIVILLGAFSFFSFVFFGGHHTVRSSYESLRSSWTNPSTEHTINWSSYFPSFLSGNPYSALSRYDPIHLKSPDGQGDFIEPEFEKDENTGLLYPPNINPFRLNRYKRANAAFVSLVRNQELGSMRASMRSIEERFNRKAGYPWVFLNDVDFTDEFKEGVKKETRSLVYFATIPKEHWSYPDDIDQELAAKNREQMVKDNVIYGGSESYRHMCRFNSGFFFRQKVLEQFDYYWRVEPGVEFYCDVDYDPFLFMQANNKTYGFTITIYEYEKTIPTLWSTTREFFQLHPEYIHKDNSMNFIVDDVSQGLDSKYNLCHFWSNFEIGDLRFWRSKEYLDYFEFLDSKGGFFYERWGDAPVHSLAVSMMLPSSALHQFDDIAYRHIPYIHCPANKPKYHDNGKCYCNKEDSFDTNGYSCMRQWWRVGQRPDNVFGSHGS